MEKCTGELLRIGYSSYGKKYFNWVEATSDSIAREGTHFNPPPDGSSTYRQNSSSSDKE